MTYSSNSALHVIQRCASVAGSPIASNTGNPGNPGNPLKHTAICLSFIHCLNSCPLQQPLSDSTNRFPCRQMWCVWFKTRKHQNSFVITQHTNSFICIFFLLPSQARGFSMIASHNIKLLIRITVYPISASGIPHLHAYIHTYTLFKLEIHIVVVELISSRK